MGRDPRGDPRGLVWNTDPEAKAREFGIDQVFPNMGRRWTVDQGGPFWEFDDVKMYWLGERFDIATMRLGRRWPVKALSRERQER